MTCGCRYRKHVRVGAAALVLVAGVAAVRWRNGPQPARADSPADTFPLIGVVRDFAAGHPDFDLGASSAAYTVGAVAPELTAQGLPVYTGAGVQLEKPARDSEGRAIPPGVLKAKPITDFSISGAEVSSHQPMAVKVTVIGAAISAGGRYSCNVTTRINVGGQTFEPFGSFDAGAGGNVNDASNPRPTVLPGMVPAGTAITVDGRSWDRLDANAWENDADWTQMMTVNSESGGQQVRALRNGDNVPSVGGFMGQVSAKDMLGPYLDAAGERVVLKDNQVIYLFELGVTNSNSSAFDMQDLVVLIDLASDPSYFEDTPEVITPCATYRDTPAEFGDASTGGVSSPESFAQWFNHAPGTSADLLTINMTRDDLGVYSFAASDFHPIDGQMYGNTVGGHNRGFTYLIDASAVYGECQGQFFEYEGDGDAWLFVDGKLVLDMGGLHPGEGQRVDLDRLGLTNGQSVRFQFFYAQRSAQQAAFALRTNMVLSSNVLGLKAPRTSGLYD